MDFRKLNPWRTIAKLREQVAYLEGRLDEVSERAEEAEARAFDRAARYWQFEFEREREMRLRYERNVMQLASLSPVSIIARTGDGGTKV